MRRIVLVLAISLATAPAAAAGTPRIYVSPRPVNAGGKVEVQGAGFCPSASCGPVKVSFAGRGMGAARADATGRFRLTFGALASPGSYDVVARQGARTARSAVQVTAGVDTAPAPPTAAPPAQTQPPAETRTTPSPRSHGVVPALEATPTTVSPTGRILVHGRGFCGTCGAVAVTIPGHRVQATSVDPRGRFALALTAPRTAGRYAITARQGSRRAVAELRVVEPGPARPSGAPRSSGGGDSTRTIGAAVALVAGAVLALTLVVLRVRGRRST